MSEDISSHEETSEASVSFSLAHSGPTPDPFTLRGYEEVLPGAADRCFRMAEEQAAHRRAEESLQNTRKFYVTIIGQILGVVIILAVLTLAGIMVLRQQSLAALATVLIALGSLISVFFYGKRHESTNKEIRIHLSEKEKQELLKRLTDDQE